MCRCGTRFVALILTGVLSIAGMLEVAAGKSREPVDYLAIVRAYADAMIEHGRDVYGEQHSPLFAEELDRRTMRMLEGESLKKVAAISRDEWGIRPHDRMLGGGNPQHCHNLYQILFQLTEISGEERYRNADVDLRKPVWPGTMGSVILLMLNAHELTSEDGYLQAADHFARKGVQLFLADGCPLPKASHVHDHYEAVTNGDTLMMALLKLWLVQNRPESKVTLVFTDR